MLRKLCEPEVLWDNIRHKWADLFKISVFTFVLGILVYIQLITQWLTNPDGVWNGILEKQGFNWEDSLGRVGLRMIGRAKGFFLYPALQTIFCLFLLSLITIMLCEMFEIHQQLWRIVLGFLMVCSPSLCNMFTYYYTADAYMIAYFLSVLFVYILANNVSKRNVFYAAVLLACSLSLYQAYLGTSITLCLIYLLYGLLTKNEGWRRTLYQGGRFLISGFLGTLLYLLVYKCLCNFTGIVPTAERGFASMGRIPAARLLSLLKQAYIYFIDYYFTDDLYNNSWNLRGVCNLLIFLIIFIIVAVLLWEKRNNRETILLVILGMLLLPLAFMSIVVMAPDVSIADITGILMIPHMNFIYLFLIVLVSGMSSTAVVKIYMKWSSLVMLLYMSFTLIMYVQIFQNCMRLELNRDYALAQRVVERVESLPEYHQGMKLMIGGKAEEGNYPINYLGMEDVLQGTIATQGHFGDSINGRQYCWILFIKNYLGITYYVCDSSEVNIIMESEEYARMPIFPEAGSVKMIGEYAVVKLSNE